METPLTLEKIRPLSRKLKARIDNTPVGETTLFIDENEMESLCGICEPLYATHRPINGNDAIIVHYGADGDWTKALLVPASNFLGIEEDDGQYAQADEALEWFFNN